MGECPQGEPKAIMKAVYHEIWNSRLLQKWLYFATFHRGYYTLRKTVKPEKGPGPHT